MPGRWPEPVWLEDDFLTEQVGAVIRAGDFARTQETIATWEATWKAVIHPEVPVEASSAPQALPPALLADARRLPARDLNYWIAASDAVWRETARQELHARAGELLHEVGGQREPANPSVYAMFNEARRRLEHHRAEEMSITVWLRKNAYAVAALWPEAPVDAAWIDWRRKVGGAPTVRRPLATKWLGTP